MGQWELGLEFGHSKGVSKEDVQMDSGIQLERKNGESGVAKAGAWHARMRCGEGCGKREGSRYRDSPGLL